MVVDTSRQGPMLFMNEQKRDLGETVEVKSTEENVHLLKADMSQHRTAKVQRLFRAE